MPWHPPYALYSFSLAFYFLLFNFESAQENLLFFNLKILPVHAIHGGDDRIRTDDPWLAKPLLSH